MSTYKIYIANFNKPLEAFFQAIRDSVTFTKQRTPVK